MNKMLAMLLILVSVPSFAKELQSFSDIYNSVSSGKNIKLVINFDACDPKPPVGNILVYTKPTAVMLRQNYLQFSNSPITTNNPAYPEKPILENVTYRLTNDDKLHVVVKLITLPDYIVASQSSSVCLLNTAIKVYN
ncbi:MAG: VirK family protein [Legionella sp.]|uniref:VirK family protein n=1 Tax=Legionella sp. TaxID=459 RepID=UPI0039E44EAF